MSGIKSINCINCSADLENTENQNPRTSAFYTLNCSSRVRSPLSPATVELIPVPHALSTIFNFQTLEKVTQKANNNHPDDGDGMTGTGTGADEDRDRDRNRNRDPLKDFETTASSVPICFVCYLVLSDLYKSYAEFSQLRNKNSFLGSKLLELENHYSANKDQNSSQFQQPKLNHHRDRDPLKYQNRNTNASHFSQDINLQSQNANVTPISNSNHRVGHGPSSAPAPVLNDSSISDHLITSDLPLQAASRLHSHSIRNFPLQYQIQNEHPNRSLIAGQPAPQNPVPSEAPPLPEGYGLEEGLPDHTGHPPMDFVKLEVFEDETGTDNMDLENSRDLTEEEDAGDVGDYEDESMSSYPSSSFLMEATLGTARTGTGIGNYAAPSTSSAVVGSGDIDPFDSQQLKIDDVYSVDAHNVVGDEDEIPQGRQAMSPQGYVITPSRVNNVNAPLKRKRGRPPKRQNDNGDTIYDYDRSSTSGICGPGTGPSPGLGPSAGAGAGPIIISSVSSQHQLTSPQQQRPHSLMAPEYFDGEPLQPPKIEVNYRVKRHWGIPIEAKEVMEILFESGITKVKAVDEQLRVQGIVLKRTQINNYVARLKFNHSMSQPLPATILPTVPTTIDI